MREIRIVKRRLQSLLRRSRVEADLSQEIEIHIDQLTKQYIAEGIRPAEARQLARREFGPVESTKEQCRDMRRVNFLDDFYRDSKHAFRVLRKSPAFTITAVLSLALGIGANTVIFSVLNSLLFKPLDVPEVSRIAFVNNSRQPSNSFPNYRAIRDQNKVFESLFAYRIIQVALDNGGNGANRVWGYLTTGNYFESLRIKPVIGRFFTPAEDREKNASTYAVISYTCWRNRFGSDTNISGKNVRINGRAYTVLGVAPAGFHGTEVFFWPEVWVPMSMQPQIEGRDWLDNPNDFNAWICGRLKPGVSIGQAEANLKTVAAQLIHERPVNEGMKLTLSPPGLAGAMIRDSARAFGFGVMLLASLVLLAACANLAALQTARALERERDLSIRVSIGAGRGRLIRQLFTESLLISILGGAAGYGLALVLLDLISQWRAPLDFPIQFEISADWGVFAFTFATAIATGLLFGVTPALRAWKADPALSLKGALAPVSRLRWSARDILLPFQIALCCVLVIASLVAVRGLMRSMETPLGFNPDGAAVIGYDVGIAGYDKDKGTAFEQRALDAIAALPGVDSAAYGNSVPLSIDQSSTTTYADGTTDFRPKNAVGTTYYQVSPGYLKTIQTRLLAGRDFTAQDTAKSPHVAIVNRTLAQRLTGTTDAVGRRFLEGRNQPVVIVGVVEDGKYQSMTETASGAVFFPIAQRYASTLTVVARSRRPEFEMATEMRKALTRLDPHMPVYGVGSLRQMLGLVFLPMNAAVVTLGAFGLLALMLSVTGIYGLSSYTVSRRSREIGIRMAIGARPVQVLRFVFGRIGALVTAGAVVGLLLGIAGATVLASIVYHATSHDPIVISAAVVVIALIALGAAYGPARRAVRVDPVQSLRHD